MVAKHPGLITFNLGTTTHNITNPAIIKLFWLLCLAGGIFAVVMMFSVDIPLPGR